MSGDVGYDAFLSVALFVMRLNSPSGAEDDFGYSVVQNRRVQGDVIDVSIAGCLMNTPLFQEVQCFITCCTLTVVEGSPIAFRCRPCRHNP